MAVCANFRFVACLLIAIAMIFSMAKATASMDSPPSASPPLHIYVTVDWEGDHLDPENIAAMQQFRQHFPHIPLLQLLNPAYFLKPGADATQVNAVIRSTLLPIDTLGLHVHGWQRLVEHCGLAFQSQPRFAVDTSADGEAGVAVSLEHAYSLPELQQLIGCASRIMMAQGYPRPKHFRAGGWQLGPKLSAALESHGFEWDSSVIDADLLTTRWAKDSALVTSLKALHPPLAALAQPYPLTAHVMEFPNNATLADYTSSQQLVQLFKALLASEHRVLVLGFHQESAADFLPVIAQAVKQFETLAKQQQRNLQWMPQHENAF